MSAPDPVGHEPGHELTDTLQRTIFRRIQRGGFDWINAKSRMVTDEHGQSWKVEGDQVLIVRGYDLVVTPVRPDGVPCFKRGMSVVQVIDKSLRTGSSGMAILSDALHKGHRVADWPNAGHTTWLVSDWKWPPEAYRNDQTDEGEAS